MPKTKEKLDFEHLSIDERNKIMKLLKEHSSGQAPENKPEKIDWMYSSSALADPEQYLLGKQIRNSNEINLLDMQLPSETQAEVEDALLERCAKMDMEAKIREDPLMLIRQQEASERRRILDNRVKLKRLKALVTEQTRRKVDKNESSTKSSKKTKKHKKESKKRNSKKDSKGSRKQESDSESSSSSDSSDSDDDLLKQYVSLMQGLTSSVMQPEQKGIQSSSPPSTSKKSNSLQRSRNERHQRDSSRSPRGHRPRHSRSPPQRMRESRNRHSDYHNRRDASRRSRSRSDDRSRNRGRPPQTGSNSSHHKSDRRDSDRPPKKSTEELERLRKQMEDNARQQNVEREQRIQMYRDKLAKEEAATAAERRRRDPSLSSDSEDEQKSKKKHQKDKRGKQPESDDESSDLVASRSRGAANFVVKLVHQHATGASVEENVRRRTHYRQKGATSEDAKAFIKR